MTVRHGIRPVQVLLILGAAAVLLMAPFALGSYYLFVFSVLLINVIAAIGLNIAMGYGGIVSLGHAAFAGIGAYTAAIVIHTFALPYWVGLFAGCMVAGAAGFLLGLPSLRLAPLYVAMVTFSFGEVINLILVNWLPLTSGPNGMRIPAPTIGPFTLGGNQFYYVLLAAVVLAFVGMRNIARTRLGRAFVAMRESDVAAQLMGIDLARHKTMAFVLSAVYAGLAGGLYLGLAHFITPSLYTFGVSLNYLAMDVVGGMGTLLGPLVGAGVFTVLPQLLSGFTEYSELFSGVILLLCLLFLPEGAMGRVDRWFSRGQAEVGGESADR